MHSVLDHDAWVARKDSHQRRVEPWIRPRLDRQSRGHSHPVDDFLFDYYAFSPSKLKRWHPGFGVELERADEYLAMTGYVARSGRATVDSAVRERKRPLMEHALTIMMATASKPAMTGCFALHEWAMVYRLSQSEVRHSTWRIRLTSQEIADVVDAIGLRCTHLDAFRFFSDAATPRNAHALTRANQPEFEQPGCLHATMDLYRWAFTASPLLDSDIVADAFELAKEVRTLDMQASPYDLRELGLEPIAIETDAGRREYSQRQQNVIQRGQALRATLIDRLTKLLT